MTKRTCGWDIQMLRKLETRAGSAVSIAKCTAANVHVRPPSLLHKRTVPSNNFQVPFEAVVCLVIPLMAFPRCFNRVLDRRTPTQCRPKRAVVFIDYFPSSHPLTFSAQPPSVNLTEMYNRVTSVLRQQLWAVQSCGGSWCFRDVFQFPASSIIFFVIFWAWEDAAKEYKTTQPVM
jgi:hypothetical protein